MSIKRASQSVSALKTYETMTFYYPGSVGTGDNNVTWNLETIRDSAIPDMNSKKIDIVDNWPSYGSIDVFLNGILQSPTTDYTVAVHDKFAGTACTVTFLKPVGADDVVAFKF